MMDRSERLHSMKHYLFKSNKATNRIPETIKHIDKIAPNSNALVKQQLFKTYAKETGLNTELVLLKDIGRLERERRETQHKDVIPLRQKLFDES